MHIIPKGSSGPSPAMAALQATESRRLARSIECACDAGGTTVARFGREAIGNPSLVFQLYAGHALRDEARGPVLDRLGELRSRSWVRP